MNPDLPTNNHDKLGVEFRTPSRHFETRHVRPPQASAAQPPRPRSPRSWKLITWLSKVIVYLPEELAADFASLEIQSVGDMIFFSPDRTYHSKSYAPFFFGRFRMSQRHRQQQRVTEDECLGYTIGKAQVMDEDWLDKAVARDGLGVVQYYCAGNQQMTPVMDIQGGVLVATLLQGLGVRSFIHSSCMINLASEKAYHQVSLMGHLRWAEAACAEGVVVHCGKWKGRAKEEEGVVAMKAALAKTCSDMKSEGITCRVLLETSTGAGTELCQRLDELKAVTEVPGWEEMGGFVLDTCHLWGAGYGLAKKEEVVNFWKTVDEVLGCGAVKLVHMNDSKGKQGAHLDRHEDVGQGNIGLEGLAAFYREARERDIPVVLETPGQGPKGSEQGVPWRDQLDALRGEG